jgi:hypothetical protein
MNAPDLNILKQRFTMIANEEGIDAAERKLLAGRDPLDPATVALRRALLAELVQDEHGQYSYRNA